MSRAPIAVYLEETPKRTFACAADWPGWCRSARSADLALESLADFGDRYAAVVARAGQRFPSAATDCLEVVEQIPGSAGTEFGVPYEIPDLDRRPVTRAAAAKQAAIVEASWAVLADVVAGAPASLRKGPRGGGRDRDKIVEHLVGAEAAYARAIGISTKVPAWDDTDAVAVLRAEIVAALRRPSEGSPLGGKKWPSRYAARRIAWHTLDHAWEIEDRSEP